MKWRWLLLLVPAAAVWPWPLVAQVGGELPAALGAVGITQNLDAQLPLELAFRDERGAAVTLSDYFTRDRPVLLSLAYYRCPMLCDLVLQGMVETLTEMDWRPGEEFDVVTVSIDPRESPELAAAKKTTILEAYGRPQAAEGWHFLTGEADAIETLADVVGFGYEYLPAENEFAHPAALFVLTPEGRVSRYLLGIRHEPRDVRLAMVEAADGKIGSFVDQFILYCYRYDEVAGRYTPVVWNIMRVGVVATVLLLGAVLLVFWRREARLRKRAT
jgi:protein SCO1/2